MIIGIILITLPILILVFEFLNYTNEEHLYKIVDESCYYCIYSTQPRSIRNRNKNTCKIINNKGFSSNQIRYCKYREKRI